MVQSSSQSINSDIYNGWRRFYYTDGKKNYYIGSNGNGQEVIKTWYNKGAPTSDTYGWYLRPATMEKFATGNLEGADRDINVTIDPVSVIDKWGNPVPLKDVCRNHSLDISVNVFYSENDGKLYFEVALWDEQDSNDTTFD